jgi:hypothetical protein
MTIHLALLFTSNYYLKAHQHTQCTGAQNEWNGLILYGKYYCN